MTNTRIAAAESLGAHLRAETRPDHDAVDSAFGDFDLTTDEGYRRFLLAHARILPLAERLIDPAALIANWQGRTAALFRDMAGLSLEIPPTIAFDLPAGEAARWGALYVVEGSRLGGAMLVRSVPEGLPTAYLNSVHGPGGWRALLKALDEAESGAAWRNGAVAGAKAMFGAYFRAAEVESHARESGDSVANEH